jgi:hypothetical protein
MTPASIDYSENCVHRADDIQKKNCQFSDDFCSYSGLILTVLSVKQCMCTKVSLVYVEIQEVLLLVQTQYSSVKFEVFTVVIMENGVFWDVTPCGACKNRRFGGT